MAQEDFPELLSQILTQFKELLNAVTANYSLYLVVEREVTQIFDNLFEDKKVALFDSLKSIAKSELFCQLIS